MEEEISKHLKRPSLRNTTSFQYHSNNPLSIIKKAKFDESSMAFKEKPNRRLIPEPKTPYVEYEGDDEYLKKIKEINTLDPAV